MRYRKIGTIDSITEIPFNENIIVSGRVDKVGWMWQMGGIFDREENQIVFKNEHGMTTKVEGREISLNVLEKIS